MIVWPGLRRSVSAISRLFNSAAFDAPLTHSAIPTRAASGTTATFTRATTATVRDNEGVLRTAIAGEARFEGARRVRNNFTFSEDNTNAAYTQATVTTTTTTIVYGAAKPTQFYRHVTGSGASAVAVGSAWAAQVKVSGTPGNKINFYIMNGPATRGSAVQITLSATPTVYTLAYTATNAEALYVWLMPDDYLGLTVGTLSQTVTATQWQCEDVTAQTTQTAGEYVSVGVESAPYYHGSMVDGVKCFATDINGAAIPSSTLLGYQAEGARTNLCLQSNAFTTTWLTTGTPTPTQNAVGPDGATSAWTLTDADGVDASVYQGLTLTAAAWTASVFVKKTTGAQTSYPVLVFYPSDGTQVQAATVDTTNGVVTDWTSFTASTMAAGRSVRISSFNDDYWRVELTKTGTAATHYFQLLPAGTTAPTYAGPTISTAATGSAVFYGAQVELGSFASSYIPTTTIAVARNADVLTYSSAGNISETAGSVYGELSTLWTTSTTNIAVSAATNSYPLGVNNNSISTIIVNRDGTNFSSKTSLSDMSTGVRKRAGSWSATGIAVTGDGASPGTASYDGAYGVGASLGVGNLADGSLQWFGTIRNVRIWQRQLSASELQAITS